MKHHCGIDSTPATSADIEQARTWSARTPASRNEQQYKSKEFVSTDSDNDSTPAPSAPSSPSPPRQRYKRSRKESSESPLQRRKSLRRAGPSRAATPAATPPKTDSCRVRFDKSEPTCRESDRSRKKVEQPTKAAPSAKTEHRSRADQQATGDRKQTEGDSEKPDIDSKKLVIEQSKIDPLVQVAKQAVQNLRARNAGVSIKESPATKSEGKRKEVLKQPSASITVERKVRLCRQGESYSIAGRQSAAAG